MKILMKVFVAVLALLIVAAVGAYVYIDIIAKQAIERGSSRALGVDTTLASAQVKVFKGELGLAKLSVANPEGFSAPHFLRLDDGDVIVSLGSLRSQPVHVPRLKLSGIDVNLQKKGATGGANYQVILENLKKLRGDQPSEGEGKRFIIDQLDIQKVNVHVDPLGAGDLSRISVPIEGISLKNVGAEGGRGVTMGELSGLIVKEVFASAVQHGAGLIPADIEGELRGRLAELANLDKLFQKIDLAGLQKKAQELGLPKDLGETAKEELDKSLGGLLRGTKNKKP